MASVTHTLEHTYVARTVQPFPHRAASIHLPGNCYSLYEFRENGLTFLIPPELQCTSKFLSHLLRAVLNVGCCFSPVSHLSHLSHLFCFFLSLEFRLQCSPTLFEVFRFFGHHLIVLSGEGNKGRK